MFKLISLFFFGFYSLLPDSPFQTTLGGEIYRLDFLPYLNWFIPFDNCLKITNMWLACIAAYYAYRFIRTNGYDLLLRKIFS